VEGGFQAPAGDRPGFIIEIPKEYQFDTEIYKYFKFKVYYPAGSIPCITQYPGFFRIKVRVNNRLWYYNENNIVDATERAWEEVNPLITLQSTQTEQWVEVTMDFTKWTRALNDRYTRTVLIQPGGEAGMSPTGSAPVYAPDWATYGEFVCFFADMRWSKTN
jgi:hypothetical protein